MPDSPQTLFQQLSPDQQALVLQKLRTRPQAASVYASDDTQPAGAVDPQQPVALSLNQEYLWFLHQLDKSNTAYHTFIPLELRGIVHLPSLEQSLTALVNRHASLRTTFRMQDGQPVQVVAPSMPIDLPVTDLSEHAEDKRSIIAQQLAVQEVQRPFDLTTGPLFRMQVLRLAPDHHVLFLNMHHIITDGWSIGILFRELRLLYAAYCAGKPVPLADLPLRYGDFAQWQRQWVQSEQFHQQIDYWRTRLDKLPPLLTLPTDFARPSVQAFQGALVEQMLSADLIAALKHLSQRSGTTLFMTLATAFAILLSRYSNQEDIAIGTPIANRRRHDFEPIVGFFANTLVLRMDVTGNPTFMDLLARVRRTTLAAYQHQDVPFSEVVKAVHPQRNLSQHPLFQVMFALQNLPLELGSTAGLALSRFDYPHTSAMFDLTLECFEQDGELYARWEYDTALFLPATITRMSEHFQTLLNAIVANPEQPVSHLALLTATEQQRMLVDWNSQTAPYLSAQGIHHLIEQWAYDTPDALAVVGFAETEPAQRVTLSYHDLNARAEHLAAYLQMLGTGRENIVPICLDRSVDMLVAVLGVLKAGGAYVALDPDYPAERLAWILADTHATLLLTQAGLRERFQQPDVQVVCLDIDWPAIVACEHLFQVVESTPDTLAYLIYTSGSTGQPKGVMGTHRNLLNLAQIARNAYGLNRGDTVLQMANFAFSVFVADWVRALCVGAMLVICPRQWLLLPEKLHGLITAEAITCGDFVPAVLRQLMHHLREQNQRLPSMRLMIVGSDSWYMREYVEFRHICEPATRLLNAYGMTETSVDSCCFEPDTQDVGSSGDLMPIGRPFANVQVYIFDAYLQPVPIGVPGDLYIGGIGVARGYLNRPDLTAECFVAHPSSSDYLYKTGDRGRYRADGVIEFLGRGDNQVKLRGFRIEPGEVEAVLLQHSVVQEAVVMLREDVSGEPRLVAYVVTRDRMQGSDPGSLSSLQAVTIAELRDFVQTKLPGYMVPSAFVMLDMLPLTPNGKVDRRALPRPFDGEATSAGTAPRNATEARLAAIWAEALGRAQVDVYANFFDLGGHSLLAARLIHEIQQHLGYEVPLATLFQNPTIAQLAVALQHPTEAQPWSPLVAIQPQGDRLPFFCVHGIDGNVVSFYRLAQAVGNDQPFYGLQAAGLDGQMPLWTSVEEMASAYIAAIQTVQAHGPYLLGGYSSGGEVAFEMAQQLQQQNESVKMLILIDSYAPGILSHDFSDGDEIAQFIEATRYIGAAMGCSITFTRNDLDGLSEDECVERLTDHMRRVGVLPQSRASEHVRALWQVFKTNLQMHYVPTESINVPTILFRASSVPPNLVPLPDETLGWQALCASPVETYTVPGDHFSLLSEPHVQVLATRFSDVVLRHRAS